MKHAEHSDEGFFTSKTMRRISGALHKLSSIFTGNPNKKVANPNKKHFLFGFPA
jgi:hypothetical protein